MADTQQIAIDKARKAVLGQMKPKTREVALEFEQKLQRGSAGIVMIQYTIGARINEIVAEEEVYGSDAIDQVAAYLNLPTGKTYLYNLRNVASAFPKALVEQYSNKSMANGGSMSINHWVQVMRLKEKAAQMKYLDRILRESMTVGELENEIRSGVGDAVKNKRQGGRKPTTPSSPAVGLQKDFTIGQQFVNFHTVAMESVYDQLDSVAPDKVSDALIAKVEQVIELMGDVETKAAERKKRLKANLTHLKTAIKNKPAEGDAEKPDKAEKATETKPAGPAKAKLKKKKKRPVAA